MAPSPRRTTAVRATASSTQSPTEAVRTRRPASWSDKTARPALIVALRTATPRRRNAPPLSRPARLLGQPARPAMSAARSRVRAAPARASSASPTMARARLARIAAAERVRPTEPEAAPARRSMRPARPQATHVRRAESAVRRPATAVFAAVPRSASKPATSARVTSSAARARATNKLARPWVHAAPSRPRVPRTAFLPERSVAVERRPPTTAVRYLHAAALPPRSAAAARVRPSAPRACWSAKR